jgi:ribosome-associated heat shock protein Hsp15
MSSRTERATTPAPEGMRLDKWLWAARFYKTRALAVEQIDRGRVQVNGADAKPSREVRPGDTVRLRQGRDERAVVVRALSSQRGPAPVAQQLYDETPDSVAARAHAAEARRLAPEPALAIAHGRPTKRDRRAIEQGRGGDSGWGERWSASLDNE